MPLLPTKLRLYCFAWTIIFPYLLKAQEAQERFQRYNVNEGLSQSSVYAIFQDSKGFMWFGTGDGLNRFDGYRFESYKAGAGSKTGLSNSFITARVLEDKDGNLWFGTRSGGINKYLSKENRFEHIRIYPTAERNTFDCELIGFDSKGRLWFLNGSNLMACYDEQTRKTAFTEMPEGIRYSGEGGPNRMGLIVNDTIYFIGNWKLVAYSIAGKRFNTFLEDDIRRTGSIYTISQCHDSKKHLMWISTEKGVMQYNLVTGHRKWIDLSNRNVSPGAQVLVKDDYNRLWIGTIKSGLLCYNLTDGSIKTWVNSPNDPQSISFDIIRSLFIDRSKNLWIGTDGGGINKLDLKPPRFGLYAENIFVKCFYEDNQKNIWIGTHENGLYVLNRKTGKQTQIKRKGQFGNIVSSITTDVQRRLIIGSSNGIDYYENGRFTEVPAYPKMDKVASNNLIYDIYHTREKNILAATRLGILEGKYHNGKLDTLRAMKNLRTLILRIHQSQDGRIWVGAQGNSHLFVLKYINGVLTFTDTMFWQSSVRAFYEDTRKKILWMASEQGLIRYDLVKDVTRYITTDDGLADNYLYGVLSDKSGRLWLSSNKGLTCFNPQSGECRNYDVTDGLQSNEFNTGAFYKSPSGELFFGGINGFNSFFPEQIQNNPFAPSVVLTSLKINDGNTPPYLMNSGLLHLPHDSSTISFEFAGMEFTNQAKINTVTCWKAGIRNGWKRVMTGLPVTVTYQRVITPLKYRHATTMRCGV